VRAAYDPIGGTRDTLSALRAGSAGPANTASERFAALTREQWQNYVNTFIPIENQLIDYATDPGVVQKAMSAASTNVADAYGAQEGAVARRLRGLGVSLSADEQAAQQRATGLSRSLADVQAQNVARDVTTSRQQSLLGNPAPDAVTLAARGA